MECDDEDYSNSSNGASVSELAALAVESVQDHFRIATLNFKMAEKSRMIIEDGHGKEIELLQKLCDDKQRILDDTTNEMTKMREKQRAELAIMEGRLNGAEAINEKLKYEVQLLREGWQNAIKRHKEELDAKNNEIDLYRRQIEDIESLKNIFNGKINDITAETYLILKSNTDLKQKYLSAIEEIEEKKRELKTLQNFLDEKENTIAVLSEKLMLNEHVEKVLMESETLFGDFDLPATSTAYFLKNAKLSVCQLNGLYLQCRESLKKIVAENTTLKKDLLSITNHCKSDLRPKLEAEVQRRMNLEIQCNEFESSIKEIQSKISHGECGADILKSENQKFAQGKSEDSLCRTKEEVHTVDSMGGQQRSLYTEVGSLRSLLEIERSRYATVEQLLNECRSELEKVNKEKDALKSEIGRLMGVEAGLKHRLAEFTGENAQLEEWTVAKQRCEKAIEEVTSQLRLVEARPLPPSPEIQLHLHQPETADGQCAKLQMENAILLAAMDQLMEQNKQELQRYAENRQQLCDQVNQLERENRELAAELSSGNHASSGDAGGGGGGGSRAGSNLIQSGVDVAVVDAMTFVCEAGDDDNDQPTLDQLQRCLMRYKCMEEQRRAEEDEKQQCGIVGSELLEAFDRQRQLTDRLAYCESALANLYANTPPPDVGRDPLAGKRNPGDENGEKIQSHTASWKREKKTLRDHFQRKLREYEKNEIHMNRLLPELERQLAVKQKALFDTEMALQEARTDCSIEVKRRQDAESQLEQFIGVISLDVEADASSYMEKSQNEPILKQQLIKSQAMVAHLEAQLESQRQLEVALISRLDRLRQYSNTAFYAQCRRNALKRSLQFCKGALAKAEKKCRRLGAGKRCLLLLTEGMRSFLKKLEITDTELDGKFSLLDQRFEELTNIQMHMARERLYQTLRSVRTELASRVEAEKQLTGLLNCAEQKISELMGKSGDQVCGEMEVVHGCELVEEADKSLPETTGNDIPQSSSPSRVDEHPMEEEQSTVPTAPKNIDSVGDDQSPKKSSPTAVVSVKPAPVLTEKPGKFNERKTAASVAVSSSSGSTWSRTQVITSHKQKSNIPSLLSPECLLQPVQLIGRNFHPVPAVPFHPGIELLNPLQPSDLPPPTLRRPVRNYSNLVSVQLVPCDPASLRHGTGRVRGVGVHAAPQTSVAQEMMANAVANQQLQSPTLDTNRNSRRRPIVWESTDEQQLERSPRGRARGRPRKRTPRRFPH
ncbi:Filamin A-interacting protein 1-like [Trichinella spiralis]|uniref:Filamin A-interacting protein 1-like n=1 Tax=Trichinella spiralis TaxID=6334 RepID=A0ABR3K3Z4_TRISP